MHVYTRILQHTTPYSTHTVISLQHIPYSRQYVYIIHQTIQYHKLYLNVLRVDGDLHLVHLGHDRYCSGRGVHSATCIECIQYKGYMYRVYVLDYAGRGIREVD